MPLTLGECYSRIRAALGSNEPTATSSIGLVNEVGQRIYAMRAWKFRERTGRLSLRADLSISGATWTESSLTITKAGGFASYSFLAGDEWENTAGTGATDGYYRVASKTNSDSIVLESSIGSGADGQTDIAGTMTLRSIALPSDFDEMLHIYPTSSSVNNLELVPLQTVMEARRNAVSGNSYLAAISFSTLAAGGKPVPRLELSGSPASNVSGAFSIVYRAGWVVPPSTAEDSFVLPVPDYMASVFVEYLSLFARAVENNDPDGSERRLERLLNGPSYAAAVARDGLVQAHYGPVQYGAINMQELLGFTPTPTLQTTLLDPS